MSVIPGSVLTINGGSSSIKFAVYETRPTLTRSLHGQLDRIGMDGTTLSWTTAAADSGEQRLDAPARDTPTEFLGAWLESRNAFAAIAAVGHRRATKRTTGSSPRTEGRVTVLIIPTDEELMIARSVCRVLGLHTHEQEHRA
jgi:acetate kinase